MGIERIAAIMQGVHSNYEIDVFRTLIAKTAEIIGVTDLENKSCGLSPTTFALAPS